jgi:hypothetical protein
MYGRIWVLKYTIDIEIKWIGNKKWETSPITKKNREWI